MAAGPISPCVSSLGTGLCFPPSLVYQVFTQPRLLGSLWVHVVSPLPPAPWTTPAGVGACTVNQVFTFTLNEFLGTNHVFHLCTFCISIKMEMEIAHQAVTEVGEEVQRGVGMWCARGADGALGRPCPAHLAPFLPSFTCERALGQLSDLPCVNNHLPFCHQTSLIMDIHKAPPLRRCLPFS